KRSTAERASAVSFTAYFWVRMIVSWLPDNHQTQDMTKHCTATVAKHYGLHGRKPHVPDLRDQLLRDLSAQPAAGADLLRRLRHRVFDGSARESGLGRGVSRGCRKVMDDDAIGLGDPFALIRLTLGDVAGCAPGQNDQGE
ncbi:hypothetical protein, partial [Methylocaldum sp.]|uniref:hypothetical protein n=1 Tax=Methylocaldum sp. TaxID=1969727 RepID=UPI002D769025